jgi:hypothetical protein
LSFRRIAPAIRFAEDIKYINDPSAIRPYFAKIPSKTACHEEATTVLRKFAATASKRLRIEGEGYRRDHLRALAQRVEVADREVRIDGIEKRFAQSARCDFRRKIGYWRRSQFCTGLAEGVSCQHH